jgi:L-fucose mutarotase
MLKGVHPLLTADLLRALRAMCHGDEIAIVDANFPAANLGPPMVELAGAAAPEALDAILTLFPVDAFAVPAAFTMSVVGDAAAVPEAVADFAAVFRNTNSPTARSASSSGTRSTNGRAVRLRLSARASCGPMATSSSSRAC